MLLQLLMALHLAGLILWFGGALAGGKALLALAKKSGEPAAVDEVSGLAYAFLYRACLPGLLLTLLSGAGMLAWNTGYYLNQGWLVAKLVLSAGPLFVSTALVRALKRRGRSTPAISERTIIRLLRVLYASVAGILLLACVRPF